MSNLDNLLFKSYSTHRTLQLVINSIDRVDYTITGSNDFTVSLNKPLNVSILAYGLESLCLPKTIYNINSKTNTMEILDSSGIQNISLLLGNYDIDTLITTLETELNNLGVDTYTVTINDLTKKITITSTFAGFTIDPNNNSTKYSLNTVLGFVGSLSYTGLSITAPNIVDISGIKNAYIKIEELTEYMRDTKNLSSNFKINLNCPFGSVIYFNNQSNYIQFYTTPQNHVYWSLNFHISIVDEDGDYIDLNGSEWSMVIKFVTKDLY